MLEAYIYDGARTPFGRQDGALSRVRPDDMLGDVIKTVNGNGVNNLEDAMQLYKRLGTVGQVMMEVSRGGKLETLEYTIR